MAISELVWRNLNGKNRGGVGKATELSWLQENLGAPDQLFPGNFNLLLQTEKRQN